MQRLTREEWETHIYLNAVDDTVLIDTSIPKDIRKCLKRGYEVLRENKYEDGTVYEYSFKAPRRVISFLNVKKREVSAEQKERARQLAVKNGFGKVSNP